ncbi:MAG: hypothetical protein ACJASB_000660 [Shewanella psychromarinicola]
MKQVSEAVQENKTTYKKSKSLGGTDKLQSINMFRHDDGFVTHVDFDIAVTESASKDGGAKLSIAGVGKIGGDLKQGTETVSRVKFRVPLQLK